MTVLLALNVTVKRKTQACWQNHLQCFSRGRREELKTFIRTGWKKNKLCSLCLCVYFLFSFLSKRPCLDLCCTVEASGVGLLGCLAQLYLLLDGTSWVVDERVDQTSHCKIEKCHSPAFQYSFPHWDVFTWTHWPVNTPPIMAQTPVRKCVNDLKSERRAH